MNILQAYLSHFQHYSGNGHSLGHMAPNEMSSTTNQDSMCWSHGLNSIIKLIEITNQCKCLLFYCHTGIHCL